MVTRWTFAGLGAPIHLDDSPAVVHHYGSLFSTSLPELMLIVAGFAVSVSWSVSSQPPAS